MDHPPHILLVNPWVHDFAAYDFWANPLGLLTLGGILREHGARISYLNCLDRFHPKEKTGTLATDAMRARSLSENHHSQTTGTGRYSAPFLHDTASRPDGFARIWKISIRRTSCW